MNPRRFMKYWIFWAVVLVIGYWLVPIRGSVILLTGDEKNESWPRFELRHLDQPPGSVADIVVHDIQPWSYVELVVDHKSAELLNAPIKSGSVWTWTWQYKVPEKDQYEIIFYFNCHTGCEERSRMAVGQPERKATIDFLPTKMCVVLPDSERNWFNRQGWVVEITYTSLAEESFWGVDDLASRIAEHTKKGLHVLVRVDYDQKTTLPPPDDYVALAEYLAFFSRLARDQRMVSVYGYIVGNEMNTFDAVTQNTSSVITPEWYARVFSGYGEDPHHTDNVVQTVRQENPHVRIIVGPVRPWSMDADGINKYAIDMPWLNYLNTLVALLDEADQIKNDAGIPLCRPDGFDIQVTGLPDAPEMAGYARYDEPRQDLKRDAWQGARIGFSVYKDWLDIINQYPSTRGAPVFIVSTNTYDREANIPPVQNYPDGWLTTAAAVVNAQPQIQTLCWFLDTFPHSDKWDWFSLKEQTGRLVNAADEFNALLQIP
ncbi:MAG: hypothetical protein P1S60_07550 [Anaerolineae bacterium]|nr:hypothetical protein [Anaerolineae bacterium]